MKKYILLNLILFFSYTYSQNITLLDSITKKPIQSVVIENSKGIIIAISDEKGQVKKESLEDINYTSHISYHSKKIIKNDNTKDIFLSVKKYELPEVVVQANNRNYDFIVLKSYFRTYQYADSIPIFYTEGFVDFYIPKKGNNLKYDLKSVKVYENQGNKKIATLKKGALFMKDNGVTNFLLTDIFPYKENYKIIKKSENDYQISYKGQEGAGTIQKIDNIYKTYLNKLFPDEIFKGSFMGRTNVIRANNIYQEFPAGIDLDNLDLTDFSLYRCFRNIETTHKKETLNLVNIFEIFPIEKSIVTKAEIKNIKLESFFGNIEKSINTSYFKEQSYNIPSQTQIFNNLLETDLKLIE